MKKLLLFTTIFALFLSIGCAKDDINSDYDTVTESNQDDVSDLTTKNYIYPYDKIKGYWKLQTHLPHPDPNKDFVTIAYEPLKTYTHNIYKMVGSHVQVTCPATGATTSNSSNPRTELRQLTSSGNDISWSPNTGTRTLRIKFKVMEMTSAGAVATAQVFSSSNGGDQIKIQVRRQSDNSLDLQFSGDAVGSTFKAADNISLNRWIDVTITINSGNASISYNYNKGEVTGTRNYNLSSGSDYYFKAGTYVLSGVSGKAVVRFTTIKASYTN